MSRMRPVSVLQSILCLSLGAASLASAKLPDPANCEAPDLITLVGCVNGVADPLGDYTVVIRDFNNIPIENESIVLAYAHCSDSRVCASQGDPDAIVDCAGRSISKRSDMNGRATFRIIGCAANLGGSAGAVGPTLEVFGNGIYLKTVRVAALDQNGSGVDGTDLSMFLADYFSGQPFARSDYDGDGALTGIDLSLWLAAFFAGNSVQTGGAVCP